MYVNILPKSSDLFAGREKELKKLEKTFYEINLFYIEGIAGIGKTFLLLKWANTLIKHTEYNDRILWMECREDWTLDNILMEIDDWLVSHGEISIKEGLTEIPLRSEEKLLYIINLLNKKNYIFFIDSFQNINQESSMLFIKTVKTYIRTSRVYVISNESLLMKQIETMDIFRYRIKGLEREDSLLLIEKFFDFHDFKGISDRNIFTVISDRAKGHPLTLRNLLASLITGISTAEDIIKEEDIEKYIGKKFWGKLLGSAGNDEKKILEMLSLCRIPLPVKIIQEISCIKNISQTILSLESMMIIEKDHNCSYFVQPLLKEYICHNLPENKKNIIHNILGEYFAKHEEFYGEAFYHWINCGRYVEAGEIFQKFMKNLSVLGYYEEILRKLELLERHIPLTDDMKILKADVLIIQGNWKKARIILENLQTELTDETFLGDFYYSMTRLYMYIYDIPKAIEFCEKSLDIFRKAGNVDKTVKVINSLIFYYDFSGKSKKSEDLLHLLSVVTKKENNKTAIVFSLMREVKNLLNNGNFEKALTHINVCFEMGKQIGNSVLISWALQNKGKALLKLQRYDEAWECFEKNLSSGKENNDKFVMAYSYHWFGWISYEKGNIDKAAEFFKKSSENFLAAGNNICAAYGEYNIAYVLEDRKEFLTAIDLYSNVLNTAIKLSDKKLEIMAEIQLVKNRLKVKELCPDLKSILKVKKKIPEDFIDERIEINLILADIYHMKYKEIEKNAMLKEGMKISEKTCNSYILTKLFYIMSKISNKSRQEKELLKKRWEEYFNKLSPREKRELECLFNEINKKVEESFFIKLRNREFIAGFSEIEELRNKKDEFEFFIDIPGKFVFEKNKGEINIFGKKILLSLLLFFINNRNGASVEDIYKAVWGWEYDVCLSAADVRKYICRLRDLVEPDKKNLKYILLREGRPGEKGKYFFSDKVSFCFIDEKK